MMRAETSPQQFVGNPLAQHLVHSLAQLANFNFLLQIDSMFTPVFVLNANNLLSFFTKFFCYSGFFTLGPSFEQDKDFGILIKKVYTHHPNRVDSKADSQSLKILEFPSHQAIQISRIPSHPNDIYNVFDFFL